MQRGKEGNAEGNRDRGSFFAPVQPSKDNLRSFEAMKLDVKNKVQSKYGENLELEIVKKRKKRKGLAENNPYKPQAKGNETNP